MKKKNIFGFIFSIVAIIAVMALNFNTSQSNNQNDVSLLNIEVMTQASAENFCTYDYIGYFCYDYDNGNSHCTPGTCGSCLDPC